jgi:hypothetical protein
MGFASRPEFRTTSPVASPGMLRRIVTSSAFGIEKTPRIHAILQPVEQICFNFAVGAAG